jgi:hypothetical protein
MLTIRLQIVVATFLAAAHDSHIVPNYLTLGALP